MYLTWINGFIARLVYSEGVGFDPRSWLRPVMFVINLVAGLQIAPVLTGVRIPSNDLRAQVESLNDQIPTSFLFTLNLLQRSLAGANCKTFHWLRKDGSLCHARECRVRELNPGRCMTAETSMLQLGHGMSVFRILVFLAIMLLVVLHF